MDLAAFFERTGSLAHRAHLPFSLVEGGLLQGGLIELSGSPGSGRIEALLRFLAENPGLQTAWVEEGSTLYPCAFPQHGVELDRVLFVNAEPAHPDQKSPFLDCAHQILKSGIFGALVLLARDSVHVGFTPTTTPLAGRPFLAVQGAPRVDSDRACFGEIELRRLQIAASRSGTTVFILREKPSVAQTWPLSAQLRASRDGLGEVRIEVLKRKFFSQARIHLKGA